MQYSATEAHDMTSNNAFIETIHGIDISIQNAMNRNSYNCFAHMDGGSAYDVAHVLSNIVQMGYDVTVSKYIKDRWSFLIRWDSPDALKGNIVFQEVSDEFRNDIENVEKELHNFKVARQVVE